MNHDLECPHKVDLPTECVYCDIIDKVRWSERERAEKIVYRDCNHTKYLGCPPCPHDLTVRDLYEETV
jgi:hypothetical protein